MSPRTRAFLIHFSLSATVLGIFCFITLFWWYPGPLLALQGGVSVLLTLLTVDVILGPSLTALVYKPGKWGLKFDLTAIVLVQIAALSYGAMTIYAQRTHYLAFTLDRFFVVSTMDTVGELPRQNTYTKWRRGVLTTTAPVTAHTTPKSLDDLETAGVDEILIPPLAIMAADQTGYPDQPRPDATNGMSIDEIPDPDVRTTATGYKQKLGLGDNELRAYRVVGKRSIAYALVDVRTGEIVTMLR